MKKRITAIAAAGLVAGSTLAGAGFTADFASAYVFRGATFNDGFVVQPGVEVDGFGLPEEYGSIAAGAWGNFDVDAPSTGAQSSEFSEVDWYASYSLPTLVEGLGFAVGWTEYTYPLGGVSDKEANIGISGELGGFALGTTAYFMVGGEFTGQVYVDFSASYAIEIAEGLEASVGALVGYIKQADGTPGYSSGGAEDGFNDGVFDAALSYALTDVWSVGASVAYIAQLDDEVLTDVDDPVSPGSYDVDFVGMLSVGAAF